MNNKKNFFLKIGNKSHHLLSVFAILFVLASVLGAFSVIKKAKASIAISYNLVNKWGTSVSGDYQLSKPVGVATDSKGNSYVVENYNNNRVKKFDPNGNYISTIIDSKTAVSEDIVIDHNDHLFMGGPNEILEYNTDGQIIKVFGRGVSDQSDTYQICTINCFVGLDNGHDGSFSGIGHMAVDARNNLYVTDWNYNVVQKFDSNGNFLMRFGVTNSDTVVSVEVDSHGNIYTSDYTMTIRKFNPEGVFLQSFGSYGSGDSQFSYPTGIAMDSNDYLYVFDSGNNRVQVFNTDGVLIAKFGGYGTVSGKFYGQVDKGDISIDSNDNIFITDFNNYRVQEFKMSLSKMNVPAASLSLRLVENNNVSNEVVINSTQTNPSPASLSMDIAQENGLSIYWAGEGIDYTKCIGKTNVVGSSWSWINGWTGATLNPINWGGPTIDNPSAQTLYSVSCPSLLDSSVVLSSTILVKPSSNNRSPIISSGLDPVLGCFMPDFVCPTAGCDPADDPDCSTVDPTHVTGLQIDIGNLQHLTDVQTFNDNNIQSQTPNVHGYAWSSNIGWISLNCADPGASCANGIYGVNMDPVTGDLSGYAWSSNIGWISFSEFNCPTEASNPTCQANINTTTGEVKGWIRALNGFDSNISSFGGWDGWISLKGKNDASIPYGVVENTTTGALTSYAWGSYTTGWVEFDGHIVPSTLSLSATPSSVSNGGNTTLTWSSPNINFTNCKVVSPTETNWVPGTSLASLNSGNSYSSSVTGVTVTAPSTTYTVQCSDPAGTVLTASATVDVCVAGDPLCVPDQTGTSSLLIKVEDLTAGTNATAQSDNPGVPNVSTSMNIVQNNPVHISWGAQNVDYSTCVASGASPAWNNNWAPGTAWTGATLSTLGGPVSDSAISNYNYTVSCHDLSGTVLTSSVQINLINCDKEPTNPACFVSSNLFAIGLAPGHVTCEKDKRNNFVANLQFAIDPWTPGYSCTLTTSNVSGSGSATYSSINVPTPPPVTTSPYTIGSTIVPFVHTLFSLQCSIDSAQEGTPAIDVGTYTVNQCEPSLSLTAPTGCVKPDPNNNIILSWNTTLMDSCVISGIGNPDYTVPATYVSSGATSFVVTAPSTTFTMTCLGADGRSHVSSPITLTVDSNCIVPRVNKPPHFIER